VEFTLHTDPIDLSYQFAAALYGELAARLPALQPQIDRLPDAEYITIKLDGELARPAPGVPGTDEVVIDATEAVMPVDAGLLLWFLLNEDRSKLVYWRVNKNDPSVSGGPLYFPPY
jgi:hypothetical protein